MADRGLTASRAQTGHQHALGRLRDKFPTALSVDDVVDFVFPAVERDDKALLQYFARLMLRDPNISYNERDRTYRYKPPFHIRSPEQLIAHFQAQKDALGIEVSLLKKGWSDCDTAIDKLEREHKLVVLRNKKDNNPRVIFADDPTLFAPLDKEFVDLWMAIPLPSKDDVIRFLIQAKRTPAGLVAENKAVAKIGKKPRKNRQSTKQTNKHMQGLFRDYSAMRQKGK